MRQSSGTIQLASVFDGIFFEIADANASSDEIAALSTLWETEIRELVNSTDQDDLIKVDQFIASVDMVFAPSDSSYCFVTVSTTGGDGAEIEFYKSLLNPSTAVAFGLSTAQRTIERALWTFVSYRYHNGERVETGRFENVQLPNENTMRW